MILFLGLSMVSMAVMGIVFIINIHGLGRYAVQSNTALGVSAIEKSTSHLINLGENIINQKAADVAKQVELYLSTRPGMTISEMRTDPDLRKIVVQPVGSTGYSTLIDPDNAVIIIHKFTGQEKQLDSLQNILPTFWKLLKSSIGKDVSGYYDWQEVDGTITQKYASVVVVKNVYNNSLTLWATTYINEFLGQVEQSKTEITSSVKDSENYINHSVEKVVETFTMIFTALIIIVVGIALLLAHIITKPIHELKSGAEAIGKGQLDYQVNVKSRDELGDLAASFNKMSMALKSYMDELKQTASVNLEKEKQNQDNLRLYVQKVGEAQEAERKRIARDLHDETVQALIAVARKLDDLTAGNSKLTPQDIRKEVKGIIEGVRQYSQELRPSILDDLGFVPALNWLAANMKKNHGISVHIEIEGGQIKLPADVELMLFRITQEAFTNIHKHSHATNANVKLISLENNVRIVIADNGKGFELPKKIDSLTKLGKLGLVGIKERVELLKGNIVIWSEPGKGTTLSLDFPLK
jgi:signal transduction histidine kinase